MADPATTDWLDQLPRQPGPTPDTEYIQSPADNLWYQVPKLPQAAPPPEAEAQAPAPEQPGLLERAWDWNIKQRDEFRAQIHPELILHENPLASLARWKEGHPLIPDAVRAQQVDPLGKLSDWVSRSLANRNALIPESAEQQAAAVAQQHRPGIWTPEGRQEVWEGLKALPGMALEHPGAVAGGVLQATLTDPEYLATGDLGAAGAAGRVAEAAGAGARATAAARALGHVAGSATSFGGIMAGAEAIHELGDGAVDPGTVSEAGLTGAALGGAFGAGGVLINALRKPVIGRTFNQLEEMRRNWNESLRGAPGPIDTEIEGPKGAEGTGWDTNYVPPPEPTGTGAGGPEPGIPPSGGGAAGASTKGTQDTLFSMVNRARKAGVDSDALSDIIQDRVRRNISDADARTAIQDLLDRHQEAQSSARTESAAQSGVSESSEQGASDNSDKQVKEKPVAAAAPEPAKPAETATAPPASATESAAGATKPDQRATVGSPAREAWEKVQREIEERANQTIEVDMGASGGEYDEHGHLRTAPKPDESGMVHTTVAGQPVSVNVEPTELQKASGNYAKGHVTVSGIPITIENPAGTTRTGVGEGGKPWESTLTHDYGYIKRTVGGDGDQVDAFVGPHPDSDRVYVIDQANKAGDFDEHKAMVGFESRQDAIYAYKGNYPAGWEGLKHVTPMSVDQFKDWLASGNTRAPAHGQESAPVAAAPVSPAPSQEVASAATAGATPTLREQFEAKKAPRQPIPGTTTERILPDRRHPDTAVPAAEITTHQMQGDKQWTWSGGHNTLLRGHGGHIFGSFPTEVEAFEAGRDSIQNGLAKPYETSTTNDEADRQRILKWTAEQQPNPEHNKPVSPPAVEPEPEATPESTLSAKEQRALTDFTNYLANGKLTAALARQAYEQRTGQKPEGVLAKRVEELTELAVVRSARAIVASAPHRQAAYDKLQELYERQPTFGTRTSTSIEQQAYSTPAPLAFIASHLAGITAKTTVLEPTAGNGMLLMAASQARATVNELNPDRANALRHQGFTVTEEDATQADFGPPVQAVIANPPFGVVRNSEGGTTIHATELPNGKPYATGEIDHAIALHALNSMMDDGRAVLIVGGINKLVSTTEGRSDAYNGAAKRKFFYALQQNYNVTDIFTVSGSLYAKQGAAWPVDVIVIAGRGKSARELPAVDVPRVYNSWAELKPLLDQSYEQPSRVEPGHGEQRPADLQRAGAGGAGAEPGGVPTPPVREAPVAGRPGAGQARAGEPAEPTAGGRGPATGTPDELAGPGGTDSRGEQPERGEAPAPAGTPSEPVGAEAGRDTGREEAAADGPLGTPGEPTGELGQRRVEDALVEGGQQAYKPASKATAIGTLVPTNMRTSVGNALESLENRVGGLDAYVAKELGYPVADIGTYFSAEQVDALGLALSQMKNGRGFIIGDQTGVGKGRVVAGVIRWALKNGQTPIFVTEKPNLYADMYRDLTDINVKDIRPIMTNGGETVPLDDKGNVTLKTPGSMRHNADLTSMADKADLGAHNMIFTTYSQMQTLKEQSTARMGFLRAFAQNAIVIFDESHNAGGQDAGSRGRKRADDETKTGRAAFAREIAKLAKGVFYSSATYAKRPNVMDLYFKTDMALAVEGNVKKLPAAIQAGGVPLQQVVASMLSDAGQYIRRERSFDGVEYNTPVVPVDRESAEAISAVMLSVKEFDDLKQDAVKRLKQEMKREAKMVTGDGSTGGAGAESTNFTSIMHNLIDQMLLALKADAAADRAIAAIKRGEHPVITVANTMGSFIEHYADDAGLKSGDAMALSFRDLLSRYLERSRDVTTKDVSGNISRRRLDDEELGRGAVDKYESVKRKIKNSKLGDVPVSPIDWIHHRLAQAGYKSSEITGRTHTVRYSDTGPPTYQMRPGRETSIAGRRKVITDFNSGASDAVVLNQAGATGLSLHASEKFKDQRRRRMILAQPEKNIDTHMQMLGRVHRTGQVVAPGYDQMVADIPAEKRPAAVLSKKMASLNANTTGARSSQFSAKDTLDFINQYGDEAAASMMEDMPEVHIKLGEPLEKDEVGFAREDAARKVTGRLPLLPVAEQEAFYELLEQNYQELIDRAEALGENALEAKTLALDAKPISQTPLFPGKPGESSPFAAGATAQLMDVKRLGKPHTTAKVLERMAENAEVPTDTPLPRLQNTLFQKWDRKKAEVRKEYEAYMNAEEAKMAESEMTEGAKEGRTGMLAGQMSQWLHAADMLAPGRMYSLNIGEGSRYYGVLQKITRKKGVKMPMARGSWLAHFDVADGMREITFPFSKLVFSDGSIIPASGAFVDRANYDDITRKPIMELFDEGQSTSREKRTIVTGNLLAGFSKVGRGQITNFTDHEGRIQQGVLMPRSFDLKTFSETQPVELTVDMLARFFSRAPQGIVETSDGLVTIRAAGDRFLIQTPRSKAEGGKYYLDDSLREIVGDFVSTSSSMRAFATAEQMRAVAAVLRDKFEQRFQTQSFRDEAKSVGGTVLGEVKPKVQFRKNGVVQPENKPTVRRGRTSLKPAVRDYLQQVAKALKGVAKIHIHETPTDLGEWLSMDLPDNVAAAYVDEDSALHFIASQVPDVATAQRLFRHEGFGHMAMEKSTDFKKALDLVGKLVGLGGARITALRSEIDKLYPEASEETKRKEMIALMVERGLHNAIVDRAVTGARAVLQKTGDQDFASEAELHRMIVQAARGLPEAAFKLSGLDRVAAFSAEGAIEEGKFGEAAEYLGRILPESEAIDALTWAKKKGDARAIAILKELSPEVSETSTLLDAYHPVEASVPTGVLFAKHAPMDPDDKEKMRRVMDPDGRDDLSLRDRARLAVKSAVNVDGTSVLQKFVDDLASLERYERDLNRKPGEKAGQLLSGEISPTKIARGVRNLASVMTAFQKLGVPEWKNGAFQAVPGRKGWHDIVAPLSANPMGSLIKPFEFYAAARRASRLIRETNRDGTSREKNFDQETIDAGLAQGELYPELKQVFDDLQEMFGHLLDLGEASGVINPEARAIYERHDYVPFYRAEDELNGDRADTGRARGGIANQREMSGRLTGKAAPLRNIMENILMNVAHMLDASARNQAMGAIVQHFKGFVLQRVPMQAQAVHISREQIVRALKAAGFTLDPQMTDEQLAKWEKFFRRVAPVGHDIVRHMVGGEPNYYRVADPLLLDALTSWQGAPKWLRDLDKQMLGTLSGAKRLFSWGATVTPSYTARRYMRIMIDTWMQSNYALKLTRNAFKDIKDSVLGHKDLYDLMMAGAGGAQGYDADPERVRQQMVANFKADNTDAQNFVTQAINPLNWWRRYRDVQRASKNAHMLRVYRAARASGASVAEAAFRSRDIEDFAMHGSGALMQFINRTVPFLNPRVQGTYRMVRGFKDNWKSYLMRGSMVTAATLGLLAVNFSNPRYQELPEYQKDLAWHIFVGEHHFWIPRPFELGLIFGTIPERIVRSAVHMMGQAGGDTAAVSRDAATRAILDTFALNPVPQVARPFLEQAMNLDSMGHKIVSEQMSTELPQEQYNEFTSPTIRAIAGAMPGTFNYGLNSPVRLEAMIRSATASAGASILQGSDMLTRRALGYADAPSSSITESAFSSFYSHGEPRSTKYTDELYRMRDEVDQVYTTVNDLWKSGRAAEGNALYVKNQKILAVRARLNQIGKGMRELNKERDVILESHDLTGAEKETAMKELVRRKNDLARQVAPYEDYF